MDAARVPASPAPRRVRSWLGLGAVLAVVLLAASCGNDELPRNTLDPAGPQARDIDNLFKVVLGVAAVVFVLVEGVIVFALVRWRRRPGDDEVPDQVHGNTRLEIGWTIVPAVILAAIAIPTVAVLFQLFEDPGDEALQVTVTGQQWWWAFAYDDYQYEGADQDVTTANVLNIPVGRPVELTLQSEDVIHSFWTPRLNGKRDVVPGRTHTWTIEADEAGVYEGQCAEFCGTSHANMYFQVQAYEPDEWEAWLADQQEVPEEPEEESAAAEGFDLFGTRGCATCHVVEGSFDEVDAGSPSAPDLTNLFDRDCFAGCTFDTDDRNELEAWLRDPPAEKPGSLMPDLGLTEGDIDALYAYLETLD